MNVLQSIYNRFITNKGLYDLPNDVWENEILPHVNDTALIEIEKVSKFFHEKSKIEMKKRGLIKQTDQTPKEIHLHLSDLFHPLPPKIVNISTKSLYKFYDEIGGNEYNPKTLDLNGIYNNKKMSFKVSYGNDLDMYYADAVLYRIKIIDENRLTFFPSIICRNMELPFRKIIVLSSKGLTEEEFENRKACLNNRIEDYLLKRWNNLEPNTIKKFLDSISYIEVYKKKEFKQVASRICLGKFGCV